MLFSFLFRHLCVRASRHTWSPSDQKKVPACQVFARSVVQQQMSNHVGLDHVSCHNLCSGIVSNHSLLQFGFVIEHLEFAFLVTTAPHVILLVAFVTQAII